MKRIIFSIFLIIVAFAGYGQYPSPTVFKPNNTFVTVFNGVSADSVLYFPTGCGIPTDTTFLHAQQNGGKAQKLRKFAIYGDSCGGKTYLWNPSLQSWSAIGKGIGVDTIYRTRGKDSIQFKINGVYYSILDSASSGGYDSTIMQPIYRSDTAKQAIRNSISVKADTTGGVIRRTDTANKWVNRLANNATNDSIIYYIGSTRYAIKDNGGSGGSDSGFAVQQGTLSGIPITKLIIGNKRFIIFDTTAASNSGAIITAARLQQKLDSLNGVKDSVAFNNMITVTGGIAQLGGLAIQHTTFNYRGIYKEIHDSLQNGLFFKNLTYQPTPTPSYQSLMQDSTNWQVYRVKSQTFDSTGASVLTKAWLFLNTTSGNIEVSDLPIGPYAFSNGQVVATTTDTVCLNCPTSDALAAATIKGTTNIDGAILGTQTLTTGKDSLQTRFVTINTTGTSSTVLKTTYTINGSGNDTTNVQPLQIDLINASTSKKQSASLGITGRFNSNAPGFSYTLWNLTAAQGANDTTAGGTLIGATLNNPGSNGYKPFEYGMHIGATGSLGNIGTAYGLQIDDLPGFKTAGYGLRIGTMKATGAKSLDVFGTADIHFGAVLRTDSAIIMSNVTSGSSLSQFAVYDRADSRIHYLNLGAGLIVRNDSIVSTATGAGSSTQGIDSVLTVGNKTTHALHSSDSIAMQLGLTRTIGKYGDTLAAIGRKIDYFFGTSIEAGYLLPDVTRSWPNQFCDLRGDSANTFSTLTGGKLVPTMTGQINTIPVWDSTKYNFLLFEYGLNDTTTRAFFKSEYQRIIDTVLIARGWPKWRVFIISAPYGGGSHQVDSIYSNAAIEAGISKGVRTIDFYNYGLTHNYLATLNASDSIHTNVRGATKLSNCAFNTIRDSTGGLEVNQFVANHVSTFRSTNFFNGINNFNGDIYLNDSIRNTAKFHDGVLISGDGNIIEQRWIAYNGGPTNKFGVGVGNSGAGSYFLELYGGQAGGGVQNGTLTSNVFTATTSATSTGLGIFNKSPTVALDVTGAAKVSGNTTLSGALLVTGDNNPVLKRIGLYSSGNEFFGLGVGNQPGVYRTIITSPSDQGGVDIGTISSADGVTYSSIMSASNVSGTKRVGIVQTTPTHALDVNGDTRIVDSLELDKVRDGNPATDSIAVLHQISSGKFSVNKIAASAITGTSVKMLYGAISSVNVQNTTVETSLLTSTQTVTGTNTLAANYLTTGKILRYKITGTYASTTVPGNLTIRIKIGGATIATAVITNLPSGSSGQSFSATGNIFIGLVGGTTPTAWTDGIFSYDTGTALTAMNTADLNNGASGTTVTTTSSSVFDFTAQWATASAGNQFAGLIMTLESEN